MSKKKNNEYQIKYRINAVIGITVNADSYETAIDRGNEIMKEGIFDDGVDILDKKDVFVGVDNNDEWNLN